MYETDYDPEGFTWINADDTYKSIYSFYRSAKDGSGNLLFVMNFTPIARDDYRVGVPERKRYRLILDSSEKRFGGSDETKKQKTYMAKAVPWDGQKYSIAYPLPAYGAAVFLF